MDNPEKSNFVNIIGFAPDAAPNPGGKLGSISWIDAYVIPAKTGVDPELAFQLIMEATKYQGQLDAAKLGIVTRASVIATGACGRYVQAASESIAKGVGPEPTNPALSLAQAALGNNLPFVGTGKMTPAQALKAAADEYTKEATAQGFIKK
jgi:ABC-type glycerol-3-phosphate transport system substrate-binding protein